MLMLVPVVAMEIRMRMVIAMMTWYCSVFLRVWRICFVLNLSIMKKAVEIRISISRRLVG